MRINVELDRDAALNDVAKDAELGMQIYFEHNGIAYPGNTWNDFGVRLLGFWLQQLLRFRNDGDGCRQGEFVFLDGDFAIAGEIDSNGVMKLHPKNADETFIWQLPVQEIEVAVLDAAHALLSKLRTLGVRPRGIEGVEEGIRIFKENKGQG